MQKHKELFAKLNMEMLKVIKSKKGKCLSVEDQKRIKGFLKTQPIV